MKTDRAGTDPPAQVASERRQSLRSNSRKAQLEGGARLPSAVDFHNRRRPHPSLDCAPLTRDYLKWT
jgi:hypothetical protein